MEMNEKLKLQAYYYGFSETGVRSIDLVLRAVSAAGKLFHHTDQWTSEIDYPVENVRGPAPVDWIQNAADDAATALTTTQAALDAKEKECERLQQVCNDWGNNYQSWVDATKKAESERDTAIAETERLREGIARESRDVEQPLGKALGYPWYKDDQKNFPDASEADGVCVGEHTPASIAAEAASEIERLRGELAKARDEKK